MLFFSPGYLLLFLVTAVILGAASAHVRSTYRRWSGVRNQSGLTGHQVARQILDSQGLQHVGIQVIEGEITDNYDPTAKVLNLSQGVAYNASVASEGIVAHEVGHAVQDARSYLPMRARTAVLPAANFGSQAGPMIIFLGLILLGFRIVIGFDIAIVGLLLFALILVFHVVTFPVEFDASRRALKLLRETGIVTGEEIEGTRKVLTAAALTYLAAIAVSALQVGFWALQVFGRRD
ncbi:MAG TPA: zinc metallopeptidase [Candidatus Solibacter sp.]|jgi:Zn-dependent membrane protease YugP|nr:zinc metallopeptidase [Candidatus Solibacter sp.]